MQARSTAQRRWTLQRLDPGLGIGIGIGNGTGSGSVDVALLVPERSQTEQ